MKNPNTNTNTANTNTIPEVVRVICGNNYDSRIGSHSYSMWTTGEDWEIHLTDGRVFGYQRRNYDHDRVSKVEVPISFREDCREIAWEEVPVKVKAVLFWELFPQESEEEKNLFVYGPVDGAEKNRINRWAAEHQVHSREITLELRKELGEFTEVRGGASWSRMPGTGYRTHQYVVDGKWLVTVNANSFSGGSFYDAYSVTEYAPIIAARKAFGRRVARLAKAAGVPWDIAVFAGEIASDAEAVDVLKAVKAARGTADADLDWELTCGISRRVAALKELLGDNWEKLSCTGQKQTKRLADYLVRT